MDDPLPVCAVQCVRDLAADPQQFGQGERAARGIRR